MDRQMFDNFRPEAWQESGGILVILRASQNKAWRALRRTESFLASAAAATFLTLAASNGQAHFDITVTPANTTGVIRGTPLYRTDAQFATDGEVSPQLWGRLMAYVNGWPDLPPEEEGSTSEPFV